MQQAAQNLTNAAVEVPYSVVNAVVESISVASEFRTVGRFSASRGQNGEIQLAGVDRSTRWNRVEVTQHKALAVPIPQEIDGQGTQPAADATGA